MESLPSVIAFLLLCSFCPTLSEGKENNERAWLILDDDIGVLNFPDDENYQQLGADSIRERNGMFFLGGNLILFLFFGHFWALEFGSWAFEAMATLNLCGYAVLWFLCLYSW